MKHVLGLMVALLFPMGAAVAHSQKEGTIPADGATVSEVPEQIKMVFDQPMRVTLMQLRNAEGEEMPMVRNTGLEPSLEVQAEPGPLAPGRYTVTWRGLAADGHAMQGSFSFELAD